MIFVYIVKMKKITTSEQELEYYENHESVFQKRRRNNMYAIYKMVCNYCKVVYNHRVYLKDQDEYKLIYEDKDYPMMYDTLDIFISNGACSPCQGKVLKKLDDLKLGGEI